MLPHPGRFVASDVLGRWLEKWWLAEAAIWPCCELLRAQTHWKGVVICGLCLCFLLRDLKK